MRTNNKKQLPKKFAGELRLESKNHLLESKNQQMLANDESETKC